MIQIYHNPRCGKSRDGVALLKASGLPFEIIFYLKNTPTIDELRTLLTKLKCTPIAVIRQKESIWVSQFKGNSYTDEELLAIVIEHPILLERPIVCTPSRAVIGRPIEKISAIL